VPQWTTRIEFVEWVQTAINQDSIVDGLAPGVGNDQRGWPKDRIIDYVAGFGSVGNGLVLGAPGTVIGMRPFAIGTRLTMGNSYGCHGVKSFGRFNGDSR